MTLPPGVVEDAPLARLTTIGTGGPARYLARPASLDELTRGLAWAAGRGLDVVPIGLGSNLLVADGGVDALVVRLEGALARVEVEGTSLRAGGGASNAVCLHRARDAGLGGLEFACAIPGTAGGGTRMNAGAYGSDWSAILEEALVVTAGGAEWRPAEALDLSYRHSSLAAGEIVAEVRYRLRRRPAADIRAEVADLVARRKASQPTNRRTFGSVWKNPGGDLGAGAMLERCGLKGFRIGGALVSPVHANFVENAGGATTADCLAVMAECRRRARDAFGVDLVPEVALLGPIAVAAADDRDAV